MGRGPLSVATFVATLVWSWLLIGGAIAADPFAAMAVLRPAAPEPRADVTFTTLEGRDIRVQDFRGKPILLGFFTTG